MGRGDAARIEATFCRVAAHKRVAAMHKRLAAMKRLRGDVVRVEYADAPRRPFAFFQAYNRTLPTDLSAFPTNWDAELVGSLPAAPQKEVGATRAFLRAWAREARSADPDVTEDAIKAAYFRRVGIPWTSCGDAAAATWLFHGDESRGRRGCAVDISWRRAAGAPRLRRGYSAETSRGDAAPAT